LIQSVDSRGKLDVGTAALIAEAEKRIGGWNHLSDRHH
jgi:hypothetical protein